MFFSEPIFFYLNLKPKQRDVYPKKHQQTLFNSCMLVLEHTRVHCASYPMGKCSLRQSSEILVRVADIIWVDNVEGKSCQIRALQSFIINSVLKLTTQTIQKPSYCPILEGDDNLKTPKHRPLPPLTQKRKNTNIQLGHLFLLNKYNLHLIT